MEEAILWRENATTAQVLCPYCYGVHTHGLAQEESLAGQVRGSECEGHQDYRIVPMQPQVIMSALYRRKGELRRKREARARAAASKAGAHPTPQ